MKCPNCGEELNTGNEINFCHKCGSNLNQAKEKEEIFTYLNNEAANIKISIEACKEMIIFLKNKLKIVNKIQENFREQ